MSRDQVGLLLVLVASIVLFTGVGRRWGSRGALWLFWKAPKGAAKYAWDSNMALASDLGRRWIVLGVCGFYLWLARKLAGSVPPLQRPVAILWLVWFFWLVSLARWSWNARPGASRGRQLARAQYASTVRTEERVERVEQAVATGWRRERGGVDVLGKLKGFPEDPVTKEFRQRRRDQDAKVRGYLPKEIREDMPLGQEFRRWYHQAPRWMQRRWRRQEKKEK